MVFFQQIVALHLGKQSQHLWLYKVSLNLNPTWISLNTPKKSTWNLKITQLKRKNHLSKPPFLGSILIFQGVSMIAAGMSTKHEELGCYPWRHDVPTMSSEANEDAVLRRPCAAHRAICTRHCGTAPRRHCDREGIVEGLINLISKGGKCLVWVSLSQILNKCPQKNSTWIKLKQQYPVEVHVSLLVYVITLLHFRLIFAASLCPSKNYRMAAGCWIAIVHPPKLTAGSPENHT